MPSYRVSMDSSMRAANGCKPGGTFGITFGLNLGSQCYAVQFTTAAHRGRREKPLVGQTLPATYLFAVKLHIVFESWMGRTRLWHSYA
jgi:hypothetical protein